MIDDVEREDLRAKDADAGAEAGKSVAHLIAARQRRLEACPRDCNHPRPHSWLGWLTAAARAARWTRNEEFEDRPSAAFNNDQIPIALRAKDGA